MILMVCVILSSFAIKKNRYLNIYQIRTYFKSGEIVVIFVSVENKTWDKMIILKLK